MLRTVRNRVKTYDVPVTIVGGILGVYGAVASVLLGAHIPDSAFWLPWDVPFVALLASAIYVPLYGLYKTLDARFESQDRQATELEQNLMTFCQQVVAEIVEQCPDVSLNEVGTHVWLCEKDGTFDRVAQFYLPHLHKSSGVDWCKGRGVAGMAWQLNEKLAVDLSPVHAKRKELGSAKFSQLPASERYGMTYEELEASSRYHGVAAIPLYSTEPPHSILGVFLIDYTSEDGAFDCLKEAIHERHVGSLLGGCEKLLTEKLKPFDDEADAS